MNRRHRQLQASAASLRCAYACLASQSALRVAVAPQEWLAPACGSADGPARTRFAL
jgi:hypothetical protein